MNKSYVQKKVPILEHPEVSYVWRRVHLDLIGPLAVTDAGSKYILTCIDSFSRFGICLPLPDKSMHTVARSFVDNVLTVFGTPVECYSDRGLEFTGKDFQTAVR